MAPKIKVINGNSTIKEDVAKALEGQDAVIVALGTRHDLGENIAQSIFKNFVVANIVLGLVLLGYLVLIVFLFRFYNCNVR